jgi:anti-sigma B factor antagonist
MSTAASDWPIRPLQPPTTDTAAQPRNARGDARTLLVRAAEAEGCTLLRVSGPLDVVTTPALHEALLPYRQGGRRLILDLGLVEYIETPGLRLLMALSEQVQAGGGEVRLVVCPQSRVERTLALADLERFCPIFPSLHQAWEQAVGGGDRSRSGLESVEGGSYEDAP